MPYTAQMSVARPAVLPLALLGLLLSVWIALGSWICATAPYSSGTDESIRYVAFVAAANRPATVLDAALYDIEHYYYPPLYFLFFAPFFGDEPSFISEYPALDHNLALRRSGSERLVSTEDIANVPPELWRLYRAAKVVSLLCGIGVVACLAGALWILFPGERRAWIVLGGAGPLLLLPQFLYYQTLVNNDCLLNFLSALALLLFVAAADRAARGAAATGLAAGCAVAIGLGLLTKQSAVVLLPLLPALAWIRFRLHAGPTRRQRLAAGLRHLLLLCAVVVAAGGWWFLRDLLGGDPGGVEAQRWTHAWAFRSDDKTGDLVFVVLGSLVRSYIALFAGAIYGVPDRIFAAYLGIAATLGIGFAATLTRRRLASRGALPDPPTPRGWPPLVGWALTATIAFNLLLVLAYNYRIIAPHGRLLFPTLVATGALLTGGLVTVAGRGRALPPLVVTLLLCLGLLFGWTFRNRMVPAVLQPEENLVPLGIATDGARLGIGPIWAWTIEQPALLPPGTLTGLRVQIKRTDYLPQFGTVLRGAIHLLPHRPGDQGSSFQPFAIGENDNSDRWTEIRLERPLALTGLTPAMVQLTADAPWLNLAGGDIYYTMVKLDRSPLLKPISADGKPLTNALALSAVYARR